MLVGCLVIFWFGFFFFVCVCSCIYALLGVSKGEDYVHFHLRPLKCRFRMLPFSLFGFPLFGINYYLFFFSLFNMYNTLLRESF